MRIAGSWTIARPFGVPLRIHWSVPVCAFLAGGLRIAPGAWIAFLLLLAVHQAGHVIVVRRAGARPVALEVLGLGGHCRWEGAVTPFQRAWFAWGGILAQLVVLIVAGGAVLAFGKPSHELAAQAVDVALFGNLWLAGINLLPLPGLDGKDAWSLFPLLRRRSAARRASNAPAQKSLGAVLRADLREAGKRSVLFAPRSGLDLRRVPFSSSPAAPRPAKNPSASAGHDADDVDERDYTPEVLEVLDRARAIAREAGRDPSQAGRIPGRDGGAGGT